MNFELDPEEGFADEGFEDEGFEDEGFEDEGFEDKAWLEHHGYVSGFVAMVGKPNVGKSTLINAYLEHKVAIVSDKPQTTRLRQLGILTRPDAQVIFIDTPGIHKPIHRLGESMIETAVASLDEADVIVFLVDGSALPGTEDQQVGALILERQLARPVILALNKCDLASPGALQKHAQAYWALLAGEAERPPEGEPGGPAEQLTWVALSATSGHHCDWLLDRIVARLPEGPSYYDEATLTDRSERDIAAELIREQVLLHIRQEVPHAVAVVVEEWKRRPGDRLYIGATIYVEKDSQKGILIGQGGAMLKAISTAARGQIEAMAGRPVFLEVWVKVHKNWRKKDAALRWLGYPVPQHKM